MPNLRAALGPLALIALAACSNVIDGPTSPGPGSLPAPTALTDRLEPSGDPARPAGLLLSWTGPSAAARWRVYSRAGTTGSFGLRAETTSPSFDERGQPDLQYFVVAVDDLGREGAASSTVEVDERLRLPRPATLTTTSLDGAIALAWSDEPYRADPQGFSRYLVYSTSYDLDRDLCGTSWSLEGSTIAPEFVAGAMTNGVPRCFAVSAVVREGFESLWSPVRDDTPRFESRNVVVYARQADATRAGFRFFLDLNGDRTPQRSELGLVRATALGDADFTVERDGTGALFLAPLRAGTSVLQYGNAPVADLTSVDAAPATGYSTAPIEARPGYAYVFQTSGGDGFARFGAVRVSHVGRDFLILDWAWQSDPGNPQLLTGIGAPVTR